MTMHWRLRLATNFAAGLALLWGWGPLRAQVSASAPGAQQFRIAGTVVSAASGAPLEQARVWIVNVKSPEILQSVMTSGNGGFAFNQLGPGKYSLQGAHHGFIASSYDAHEEYATAIVTGAGIDTENLTLRLSPAALLSGTVFDESGEPIRDAIVTLYHEDHSIGVSQVVQVNGTNTDDLGSYEFAGLAPGNYFVSATAHPWYAVHPSAPEGASASPATVDRSLDVVYQTTYYPDVTDADQAPPVPLKGGDHVQIEIRLSPVPALHLLFHVPLDQQGFNVPTLQKRAFDTEQPTPGYSSEMIAPGVYELNGVPPGQYSLQASGSISQLAPRTEVELVSDGQVLDAAAGEPVSSVKLSVQILGQKDLPLELQMGLSDSRRRLMTSQDPVANRDFHFEDIAPGKYTVLAFAQSSGKAYAVARLSSQGAEIPGHSLNVPPGSSLEISALLATGSANVEGFAKRAGKGTPGAMIVLVPDDPENHHELFRRDQSDLDGSFNLPNVIPGNYTILAIDNGWDLDWSRPAVIMQYAKHGQPVKVGPQAKSSVRVTEPVEIQSK
jgi:hypothetical protein